VIRLGAVLIASCGIVVALGLVVLAPYLRDPPNERPEVAAALYDAVESAGNDATVDLGTVTTFPWDRMYVFPAYTHDDDVGDVVGIPWGNGQSLRLPSDEYQLLIFAAGDEITGWVILNDYQTTGRASFDQELIHRRIDRESARFRVDEGVLTLAAESTVDVHAHAS
jgi:hypothetical protein